MTTLVAENLAVGFGSRLLSGVDFTVAKGERVAVMGASGSGKTTLLRTLAMLWDPLGGEVRLGDRTPDSWGFPAWRRQVVYVAQEAAFVDGSVSDNLQRVFSFRHSTRGYDAARARNWLARLGLPGREHHDVRELSVGERQRVALVRALLIDASFLLLDEPTSALDPRASEAARELFQEASCGALIVLHDRRQAEAWCNRLVSLDSWLTDDVLVSNA